MVIGPYQDPVHRWFPANRERLQAERIATAVSHRDLIFRAPKLASQDTFDYAVALEGSRYIPRFQPHV